MDSHNNKLSITTSNQWHALWSLMFLSLLVFIGFFWFNFEPIMSLTLLIGLLIDAFPTLYLHCQYYRQNKGEEYQIFPDRLVRYKAGKKQEFFTKDILLVTVHLSPALFKGSHFHFLGIEAYYYACVFLKDGEKLLLTCLLDPKLDSTLKTLEGVPIKRKKRVFNPLQWNYI